jgi:osmoprotectant transport system permease protein
MEGVVQFFLDPAHWTGTTGIPNRLFEHLVISAIAIALATAIGLPIGLYIGHTGRFSNAAINAANIGRAVPSYAVTVMILPLALALAPVIGYSPSLGLNTIPILVAMTLLAIPPILVNSFAGLRAVDRDTLESGRGMGMREREILFGLELPLASSVIVGGFRTATLQVIATATIGAILSGGGIGRFIVDGISLGQRGYPSIYAGAILVSTLAIGVDALLSVLQRRLVPRGLREPAVRDSRRDLVPSTELEAA